MFAEGGCSCGAVRYRLLREPMTVHACHCRDCQRLSGGVYAVNLWIEKEEVQQLSGEMRQHRRQAGSGAAHEVRFCPTCGTTLMSDYTRAPGSYWWVRVGTLDEPALATPQVHIFTRSKHPSVLLPTDVPVFEGYYDRERVWSAESLARMQENLRARGG